MKAFSIYGASGHGKVILEIAQALGYTIAYVFDDNENITNLLTHKVTHKPNEIKLREFPVVFAIGNNNIRQKLTQTLNVKVAPPLIHPKAIVSQSAGIGEGTVVMPGVVIHADTRIGSHCIINTGAIIEHDCILNDFVHISPNAALAGDVTVDEGTHIGIGACVIPGIKIGNRCTIGAGAVIIKDIPDGVTVVGNPGREVKW
ncbi:acetyltransferase [uncultured Planktosalinus sp.]|uniref:acetyltransferase n=1 Tax=uncultured Planktosalinus sp. TaxID=1810935 RepID=UPI0030D96699